MKRPVRILLADDHALVRRGVRLILESNPGLTVVAEASDGLEAVTLARAQDVDLVIMDISMPRMTGLAAVREICRIREHPYVLMLSMYDNEQYFFEALKAGASGYVLKSVVDEDLVAACWAAMRGESFLYPGVESALLRQHLDRMAAGKGSQRGLISAREEQVVKLIAEGFSSKEIAQTLGISLRTVDRHRENILEKLGMRDRTELTRFAVRVGLIEA